MAMKVGKLVPLVGLKAGDLWIGKNSRIHPRKVFQVADKHPRDVIAAKNLETGVVRLFSKRDHVNPVTIEDTE